MLTVTGAGSAIVRALRPLLPADEQVVEAKIADEGRWLEKSGAGTPRYLFCHGLLRGAPVLQQSAEEMAEGFLANCGHVMRACDAVLAAEPEARICVVGSESGFAWSFDGAYAAAKAALHRYVETKRLAHATQQLVAIAPGVIGDAGMTLRRHDLHRVRLRAARHPKARLLTSAEVARLIHFALYVDTGYLSGVVVRLNGGEHTAR